MKLNLQTKKKTANTAENIVYLRTFRPSTSAIHYQRLNDTAFFRLRHVAYDQGWI